MGNTNVELSSFIVSKTRKIDCLKKYGDWPTDFFDKQNILFQENPITL